MAVGSRARQARRMTEQITHTNAVRRLERSSSDKMLAGVCGGLGRYFDLNPAVFRIGFVVLTLLGGAGVLVYLAAAFVMPGEGKERSLAEQVLAERKERPWPLIGLAIVGVAMVVLLSRAALWPAAGAGWIFVLIVGLGVLWVSRSERWGGRILRVFLALVVAATAAPITPIILSFSFVKLRLCGFAQHLAHSRLEIVLAIAGHDVPHLTHRSGNRRSSNPCIFVAHALENFGDNYVRDFPVF